MKRRHSQATIGLAATAIAAALLAAVAFAEDTSPTKVGEVGQRPGEGNPAPAASATSPAPAGEVGQRPGEGSSPPTASKPSPQRFEPTEKVRPDFDVAFPVDI